MMGKGTLTIYSASAGSGKTYKLTGIYLSALFRSRHNYRRILAVTFTNKATAEMKSRILDNLHRLSAGEKSDYLAGLLLETKKSEDWIRSEAGEILNAVLHDFSRFSVSTIDSFFQKILRAFAREAGLHAGFNIELDHSILLSSAVDEMINSASDDVKLRNWLITYALTNIEDEKSWNLKKAIIKLAEELFKENYKILSADERKNLEDKDFLLTYIEKIKSISSEFERQMTEFGKLAMMIYSSFDLTEEMFFQKGRGVPKYIRSLAGGTVPEPNTFVRGIMNDPPRWSTGKAAPQLQDAIDNGLGGILIEAINYYDLNYITSNSASIVLSNIFALGILSDVLKNVRKISTSENTFLLSDAGEILNLITRGDQSPFIYEKVGNRYENFMIDEFQDTSIIQWNNFEPLVANSMSEGFDNLVVGDVKQSIYRWRNSDWRILGKVLKNQVDNDRFLIEPLTTNWRSHSNIIRFNNALFTVIPIQIDQTLAGDSLPVSFREMYSEAVQKDPDNKPDGFVNIEFLENEPEKKWEEKVLERIPSIIESVQDSGYSASDIGIIVRNGREGAMILKSLIDYSNKNHSGGKYNFNAVSNDSLLLSNSHVICFIISILEAVNTPSDMIAQASMLRFYLLASGKSDADKATLISRSLSEELRMHFPEGYEALIEIVKQVPLFEAIESIIRFFDLGKYSWNVAYLNTFQDYVVNFTGNKNSDIQTFLDWWDSTGSKKSVVLPGSQDAMRIITIHKSKGLEFKIVILPFLSWNLDHMPFMQQVLWVKPDVPPFNELGIIPVKYSKDLLSTIFSDYYRDEKSSVYLDNINLLYVAMTRSMNAIYGFSVSNPKSVNSISGVLKNAFSSVTEPVSDKVLNLTDYYFPETCKFEYGKLPVNRKDPAVNKSIASSGYHVSRSMESLKLKLHGENYFSSGNEELRKKINYGKLMHEVFEGINTAADVKLAVRKLVLEGKLPQDQAADIERKVNTLISVPQISDWFSPDAVIMKEAGILLTSGNTRRPDRVIFKDGKTTIIDFKFGSENESYIEQVNLYRGLLLEMGYKNIEAFIWYVDKNKIVSA
jgi:ATP-dependent helicase/nuclease subunit A